MLEVSLYIYVNVVNWNFIINYTNSCWNYYGAYWTTWRWFDSFINSSNIRFISGGIYDEETICTKENKTRDKSLGFFFSRVIYIYYNERNSYILID